MVLGYTQISGVIFLENFAPVVHNMIFRLILVLAIIFGFDIRVINVEVTFLHGNLTEDIFMLLSSGYHLLQENQEALHKLGYTGPLDQAKDHVCIKLQKSLYGLVQAAQQWWEKNISKLSKIGFIKGQVDPCLIYQRDNHGLCIIALYIDDCLCVGDSTALDKAIEDIRKIFDIKVESKVNDYLGCNIHVKQGSTFIHQQNTY